MRSSLSYGEYETVNFQENQGDVSILMKNEEPTVKKGASYNTGGGAIIPTSSNNSNANSTSSNSGACEVIAASSVMRPRWCPTTEQIKILEAVFESGTTTPSRDMIVEIAECLKQFGHIVEANVFYWFQNRKARAKRRRLKLQPSYASATIIDGEVTDALLTSTLFNSSSPPPLVDALGHQDQYKYQYLHAQLAHQTFHQPRPTSNLPNMNFNPNPNPLVSNEHVHTPQTHTNKAIKLVPKGVPNNAQVQTPHINKSLMFDPQHVHKYTPLDPYIANNIKVNENYYPDPPMSTSLNMPLKRTWMEALDQAVDFVFPSVQNPDPQHHDMAHDEFHTSSTPNSSLPSKITLQGNEIGKTSKLTKGNATWSNDISNTYCFGDNKQSYNIDHNLQELNVIVPTTSELVLSHFSPSLHCDDLPLWEALVPYTIG